MHYDSLENRCSLGMRGTGNVFGPNFNSSLGFPFQNFPFAQNLPPQVSDNQDNLRVQFCVADCMQR